MRLLWRNSFLGEQGIAEVGRGKKLTFVGLMLNCSQFFALLEEVIQGAGGRGRERERMEAA